MKNIIIMFSVMSLLVACQIQDSQMQKLKAELEASPTNENLSKFLEYCLFNSGDTLSAITAYEQYQKDKEALVDSLYAACLCKQAGVESAIDKKLQYIQKGLGQFDKNRAQFPNSSLVLVYQVSTLGHFPKDLGAGEETLLVAQELLELKKKNAERMDQKELDAVNSSFIDLAKIYPELQDNARALFDQLKGLSQ